MAISWMKNAIKRHFLGKIFAYSEYNTYFCKQINTSIHNKNSLPIEKTIPQKIKKVYE